MNNSTIVLWILGIIFLGSLGFFFFWTGDSSQDVTPEVPEYEKQMEINHSTTTKVIATSTPEVDESMELNAPLIPVE